MSVETQDLLVKVKRVKNKAHEGQIVEKATRFMSHSEKESKKADLEWIDGVLSPANNLPGHVVLDQDARKNLVNYKRALLKDLADSAAPDKIPGDAKDALKSRRDFVIEKIKEGMPPHEVMRRNPTGAVSQHLKWMEKTKDYQLEYKNIQRLLEPDDSSEDLANVEMLRPSMAGPNGSAATFMADSWTPGVFAMSAQAKENWPLGEPKVDTAIAQAERRELAELRAFKAETDAKIAAMSRGAKVRWHKVHKKRMRDAERSLEKLNEEKIAAGEEPIDLAQFEDPSPSNSGD